MFIDTHCHLFFDLFSEDLSSVISRATAGGIENIIVPCIDIESCEKALDIASKYPPVRVAVGIHPNDLQTWDNKALDQLSGYMNLREVVAIGEIGLDYYRNPSTASRQKEVFKAQLDLAEKHHKPVIIHERNSQEDIVDILKEYAVSGVFHGFTGSKFIQDYGLENDFYFGIGGPITYKNRLLSDDSLSAIQTKIVLETDAPFLSPSPLRGKRNEPIHVIRVAESIAALLSCDIISIASKTSNNAKQVFHI